MIKYITTILVLIPIVCEKDINNEIKILYNDIELINNTIEFIDNESIKRDMRMRKRITLYKIDELYIKN